MHSCFALQALRMRMRCNHVPSSTTRLAVHLLPLALDDGVLGSHAGALNHDVTARC